LVVAFASSDPRVRRYETDLLAELRAARQGLHAVLVGDGLPPDAGGLADTVIDLGSGPDPRMVLFRVVTDVVVGQLLGLFRSLALRLRPDAPSADGVISRVVQGVRIYDPEDRP
jgi:tagatose-6-phosphate ketose/aldose isomerase